MNKLEQLIQELCPHGVEYKKLGEVANFFRGVTYSKQKEINIKETQGIKILRANNITLSNNTINFDEVKLIDNSVKVNANQWLFKDDILICIASGSKDHIGKVAYIFENMDYSFGGFMGVIRVKNNIFSRYLFFILLSNYFSVYLNKLNCSTITNLNNEILSDFSFPFPPLEIQKEIVRILDTFTEFEKELEKELEARKKQYEFYREQLLSFDKNVPLVSLSEIALDMYRGAGIKRDEVREKGTPCVRYGEIYTDYNIWFDKCLSYTDENLIQSKKYFEKNDILFAITGEKVEEISKSCAYIGEEKCLAGGDIVVMKHNQNVKYLSYALSTFSACKQKSSGKVKSKVVHSSIPELKKIKIPLPPLEEQERIVNILDRFDALCNDLTCGLPAEIEARRKQYAYYRDKLLTFKNIAEEV